MHSAVKEKSCMGTMKIVVVFSALAVLVLLSVSLIATREG